MTLNKLTCLYLFSHEQNGDNNTDFIRLLQILNKFILVDPLEESMAYKQ